MRCCLSQESCKEKLERAYSHSKPNSRKLTPLGHGNGFTFEASPFCSYAHKEGVHVLFAGEVSQWPGINAVDAAHDGECRSGLLSRSNAALTLCLMLVWLAAPAVL